MLRRALWRIQVPGPLKGDDLLEQLGEGAFGAVFRARQPVVDRHLANKVILPDFANQLDFIRRFETQLEHLHIVPLYLTVKVAATRPDMCGLVVDPTAKSELWNIEEFDYGEGCEE